MCVKWDGLEPLFSHFPAICHPLDTVSFSVLCLLTTLYLLATAVSSTNSSSSLSGQAMSLSESDFVVVVLYIPQKEHLLHAIPSSPKPPLLFLPPPNLYSFNLNIPPIYNFLHSHFHAFDELLLLST